MIKGIAHAAFTVADMEKSVQFYCDGLGFKKAFTLDDDKGNPWIVYLKICDGQFIELFYPKSDNAGKAPEIGYSHLCLEVDDIYEIADRMKKKGIELIYGEPKQGKDGNTQCWVKDPDGNRIEFMQMSPDSLQSKS